MPPEPSCPWILHLINRCMIKPNIIRWHVIRDRMTPWTRWNDTRSIIEKCRLELKCTKSSIEVAERENVQRDAHASHAAVLDYGWIWVECQEQMLVLNRTVAPPLIKPKVELPDDLDMHPVPTPRVKQKVIEPTLAPIVTTTRETASGEATTTIVTHTTAVTTTTTATSMPVTTRAPTSTVVEMEDKELTLEQQQGELEDVYNGHDPREGVREQYNTSSQEEQLMDMNESLEKVDLLAAAIIEGVGASFSANLQQDYQGTTGRSYTHHEYHPTPSALSPLNSADESLADQLFSDMSALIPTS